MSSIKIHFTNFRGYYFAGETIAGKLVCSFRSEKNVRGIDIKLQGTEHTEWTRRVSRKGADGHMHTHYETCTGNNNFLSIAIQVYGQGNIQPGHHEYPFSFQLPNHLPGTFSHTRGWIQYRVKAVVDRPWKTDFEDYCVFELKSPVDFNRLPNLQQPISVGDEKYVCCWCCYSGPVTLDVQLNKTAYVPGESVRPRIEISNLSNADVDDLSVQIIMTLTFKTESPYEEKEDTELIASASDTGVGAHGERIYDNINLEIPQTTLVPNFNLCKFFHCSCIIKVVAEFACHIDLEATAPITLGNIPWHSAESVAPPSYLQPSTIGFNVNGTNPPPLPTMPMPMPMVLPSMPIVSPPYPAPSGPLPLPTAPSAPFAPEKIDTLGGAEPLPPTYEEATTTKAQL